MSHEDLIETLERLERTRASLERELTAFGELIDETLVGLRAGRSVSDILIPASIEARQRVAEAVADFSASLANARAEAVRVLVDDEGWNLTDIARAIGKSRQLISRLYRDALEEREGKGETANI